MTGQQCSIVVGHLLEVRHEPSFIDGVAVKSTSKLIADTARRHLLQRGHSSFERPDSMWAGAARSVQQHIDGSGMRELGLRAETAMHRIKLLQR